MDNSKAMVLVVEDDKPIANFIKVSIETQGYRCIEVSSGEMAISLAVSHNPDVILLDLGLPDIDGLDVIRRLRPLIDTTIIVVSARGNDREKVEALDIGADDYLTKPFSVPELLARIRVALRHRKETKKEVREAFVEIGGLYIDFIKRIVYVDGNEIHLTPLEYKLLKLMAIHRGRVLTHRFIIKEVWESTFESDTQSLRVFMANMRRKIEKNPARPRYLLTEVGVGYRMADE